MSKICAIVEDDIMTRIGNLATEYLEDMKQKVNNADYTMKGRTGVVFKFDFSDSGLLKINPNVGVFTDGLCQKIAEFDETSVNNVHVDCFDEDGEDLSENSMLYCCKRVEITIYKES